MALGRCRHWKCLFAFPDIFLFCHWISLCLEDRVPQRGGGLHIKGTTHLTRDHKLGRRSHRNILTYTYPAQQPWGFAPMVCRHPTNNSTWCFYIHIQWHLFSNLPSSDADCLDIVKQPTSINPNKQQPSSHSSWARYICIWPLQDAEIAHLNC